MLDTMSARELLWQIEHNQTVVGAVVPDPFDSDHECDIADLSVQTG